MLGKRRVFSRDDDKYNLVIMLLRITDRMAINYPPDWKTETKRGAKNKYYLILNFLLSCHLALPYWFQMRFSFFLKSISLTHLSIPHPTQVIVHLTFHWTDFNSFHETFSARKTFLISSWVGCPFFVHHECRSIIVRIYLFIDHLFVCLCPH